MDILKGKTAIVTGSSSGIGKAIALLFAREGAKVDCYLSFGRGQAKAVTDDIGQEGGIAKAYRVDVADENEVKGLFATVDRDFGDVNILVNNAGINGSNTPVEDMTTEQWDRVIKTDLYGPFFCCREFLQWKKKYGLTGEPDYQCVFHPPTCEWCPVMPIIMLLKPLCGIWLIRWLWSWRAGSLR